MTKKIVSKSILGIWLQIAKQQGLNVDNYIQNRNISFENESIPFEQFCLLIEWIVKKTNNELIGLRVGTQLNLAVLGIVGQIIQSCQTVEAGIDKASENFNLISNAMTFNIQKEKEKVRLIFEIEDTFKKKFPVAVGQLSIASMVFAYREIHYLTLRKYNPILVETIFSRVNNISAIKEIFEAEIKINSAKNILTFDKALLAERIIYADFELLVALENLACKRYMHQVQRTETFSDTIKSIIYTLLDPSFPSLAEISRQVNMSERSVQRKLKEEGFSYSSLLVGIKKSIAIECLEKKMSIKETSYLLGYSESSAFVNAFKKWYGISPLKYKVNN